MIFKTIISFFNSCCVKSRRDDTLLTVGFNLRTGNVAGVSKVPQGRHLEYVQSAVPAGLASHFVQSTSVEMWCVASLFRRLKPTVNRVPSLQDFYFVACYRPENNIYLTEVDKQSIQFSKSDIRGIFFHSELKKPPAGGIIPIFYPIILSRFKNQKMSSRFKDSIIQ